MIEPSRDFVKAWRIENTGDAAWEAGYHLVFIGGEPMAERLGQPLPPTQPGQQADVTLVLTAPEIPGTYAGQWRLQDDRGVFFGAPLLVRIVASATAVSDPDPAGVSNGRYRADLTIPDGTRLPPGTPFTKSWEVENTGETTWSARFSLVHIAGEPMTAAPRQPLPAVAPGARAALTLQLTAPAQNGRYVSHWQLHDPGGAPFGEVLFLDVVVAPAVVGERPFAPDS
ncbi:MAG: hypothetical protein KC425_23145, partial [Anaerolineales bacterium]|nr:hypothetical protein [Anaerolineales bacterium]